MGETYAVSKDILNAIERLQAIPVGDRSPRVTKALAGLLLKKSAAMKEVGATGAAYRGALQGGTFNLADEVTAAAKAPFTDLSYGEELATVRGLNAQAQGQFPKEYSRGEVAGGIASTVLPFGLASKSLKGAGLLEKSLKMGRD